MRPRARGRVTLVSPDPAVPPVIEHRYDSEPADVATLRGGSRAGARPRRYGLRSARNRSGRRRSTCAGRCRWAPTVTSRARRAVPGPRRRRTVGGRRFDHAEHHQPRSARHHRDDRSPRGGVHQRLRPFSLTSASASTVAATTPSMHRHAESPGQRGREPRHGGATQYDRAAAVLRVAPSRRGRRWARPSWDRSRSSVRGCRTRTRRGTGRGCRPWPVPTRAAPSPTSRSPPRSCPRSARRRAWRPGRCRAPGTSTRARAWSSPGSPKHAMT